MKDALKGLHNAVGRARAVRQMGHIRSVGASTVDVVGLSGAIRLGDELTVLPAHREPLAGEVVALHDGVVRMMTDAAPRGIAIGDGVVSGEGMSEIFPSQQWIGRITDPYGNPLDGRPLLPGGTGRDVFALPPPAAQRTALGARLDTGFAVFNTFLPIVRGQRIGLFAGSGVGKSHLLGGLARSISADLIVVALIGERGRELGQFVRDVLGKEGLARAIVVAATSDQPARSRRRCVFAAMAVAEHFRDKGLNVVFLADSITRMAEAHREISIAGGEAPALAGHPASIIPQIMGLSERAGPGLPDGGTITAIFSVLVPGSDMEEPIADVLRGVLDGHVVLNRDIAERGRFPAVDLLRSVSRSLPDAASKEENVQILRARAVLGRYEGAKMMIEAGLYAERTDAEIDQSIRLWPELDQFLSRSDEVDAQSSFSRLSLILRRAETGRHRSNRRVTRPED